MTPTIRVDDEVYALLQQRGEAFVDTPNTVLRRILGLSDSDESTGHPVGRRGGRRGEDRASRKLAKLVADDLLSPDEELVWERRNNGERHTARVGADGTLAPRGRPRGRQSVGRRPPPGGLRGQRLARLAPGRRHPARGPLGSARQLAAKVAGAATAAATAVVAADVPRTDLSHLLSHSSAGRRLLAKVANNASRPGSSALRPATDISSEASDESGPANHWK